MSYPEEADKFVWAYMIEKGHVTDGEWNYYGGNFDYFYENKPKKQEEIEKEVRTSVKEVGIDWEKTKHPEVSHNSCFEGTFTESSSVESLLGTLHLNNGKSYMIGVGNSDVRFSAYLQYLSKLNEDRQRIRDVLGE